MLRARILIICWAKRVGEKYARPTDWRSEIRSGQVANEACKIHVSQAGQPARQACNVSVPVCRSFSTLGIWKEQRAFIFIRSGLIYIQSRAARPAPPIFHVSLVFYIPLISMFIMVLFASKKCLFLVHVPVPLLSVYSKEKRPIWLFCFLFSAFCSLRQGHFELGNYNSTKSLLSLASEQRGARRMLFKLWCFWEIISNACSTGCQRSSFVLISLINFVSKSAVEYFGNNNNGGAQILISALHKNSEREMWRVSISSLAASCNFYCWFKR